MYRLLCLMAKRPRLVSTLTLCRRCSGRQTPASVPPPQPQPRQNDIPRKEIRPSNFQKKCLVWTGRYKTEADIPETVSHSAIHSCETKMRIKAANWMMVISLIVCVIMAISGKRAFESGDSLHKRNIDWHEEYNKSKQN